MNVVHETVGPPPPLNAIPVASYRPYTLTISLSAEERKRLFRAAACTNTPKCRGFADNNTTNGEVLYATLAGIYYALRDQGETL